MDMQETHDRMSPYCRNRAGVALGRILASASGIRCDYRCPSCAKDFVVISATPLMIATEWSEPGNP